MSGKKRSNNINLRDEKKELGSFVFLGDTRQLKLLFSFMHATTHFYMIFSGHCEPRFDNCNRSPELQLSNPSDIGILPLPSQS